MLQAYAWVNIMPFSARRSMLGVSNISLYGVFSVQKGSDVSCHPMSSTRNRMMFGRFGSLPVASEWPVAGWAMAGAKVASDSEVNKYLFMIPISLRGRY